MLKVLLCVLAVTGSAAYAAGSVYNYVGLDHAGSNLCESDLQLAIHKIEQSGIGHANTLEGFCDGNNRPRISLVSDLEDHQLNAIFKNSEAIQFGDNRYLDPEAASRLMQKVVPDFESADLLFLEIGHYNGAFRFRVLDVKGTRPTIYYGLTYTATDCAAKLTEIVQDFTAQFGKAAGLCAKDGSTGYFPAVFYLDGV